MNLLKVGSKVGVVACSNGFPQRYESKIEILCDKLIKLGLIPVLGSCIHMKDEAGSRTGKERARELMSFYEQPDVTAIFDISGGNLANEVIEFLDYESIKRNPKPLFGYSDLTCVLNAITAKTGVTTYLYQIRNITYGCSEQQMDWLQKSLFKGEDELYQFPVTWIQGNRMEGVAVGGNIRCFLKLAGTPYFPKMKDKILVLEAYGGKPDLLTSFLTQLRGMGVFDEVAGILLGTFTEMEAEGKHSCIGEIVKAVIDNPKLPIARTSWIGHGNDSKCIRIGESIQLEERE